MSPALQPRRGGASKEGVLEHVEPLDARQFQLAVRRLADTLAYGTDHSRYLGSGIEYVQSRPYQYGDPVRSIDWRITARTGKVHIKDYGAPKRMPCYLLLDTSASMTLSSVARSKYALALHLAGGIALACLDRVSPVGVLGVGDRDLRIEPSLAKDQVMRWLLELRRFRYDEQTTLGRGIRELQPTLKNRSLVIVISDLHDPAGVAALKLMGQMHDCVALQLRDPAEDGLRGAGFMRAREVESGRPFVTHGRADWIDHEEAARELRRGGVDHLVLRTDAPVAHLVRHFFAARGLLGRGAR